jgi:actin-related protein
MSLFIQLLRHIMFTMAADMARNPEKYQYHARQAKKKADEQYEKLKTKISELRRKPTDEENPLD